MARTLPPSTSNVMTTRMVASVLLDLPRHRRRSRDLRVAQATCDNPVVGSSYTITVGPWRATAQRSRLRQLEV
jgi:hypothetical protein